jgi:uncharacterized RmlC-like cupin family protein
MDRKAAINFARVGAQKLWAGTVTIHPDAKTGAHHHGHLESVIYVVKGKARMRWGEQLQFTAEAGPGDFIFVPPYVPHQEINASPTRCWNACWCAATARRWRSTSTSSRSKSRIRPRLNAHPNSNTTIVGIASSPAARAASQLCLAVFPSFGTCSVSQRTVCVSSRRVIELSADVSQLTLFVPIFDDWTDDIAQDLESALGGAPQGLRLLAHGDDLHLRLAALGDSDGLAAFGDLVDQGEAPRLEGGGVDLPLHGETPM